MVLTEFQDLNIGQWVMWKDRFQLYNYSRLIGKNIYSASSEHLYSYSLQTWNNIGVFKGNIVLPLYKWKDYLSTMSKLEQPPACITY